MKRRRRAEEAPAGLAETLERERTRYRTLFDRAPDPYLVTDEQAVILEHNRRSAELLAARNRGALVLCIAPSDRAKFHRFVDSLGSGAHDVFDVNTTAGVLRMEALARRLEGGELLWLFRDVTELEAARRRAVELARQDRLLAEQLREVDDMRRAFVLAVSHDLRTPLSAILGLAETLVAHPSLAAEDQAQIHAQIVQSSQRVLDLFTGLMDLERLERQEVAVRRQETLLGPLVTEALSHVDLGSRTLVVDVDDTVASLDPLIVTSIIENLLRNVARHTPQDAHVWLRCRREPDGVWIAVEDDGDGVPPEARPTIFELFHRSHASGLAGGLGVGLALVRRFATLHGGYARYAERLGGGASFQVVVAEQ